jgi:1-phosphatidylinositol-3-phosphate 5-kinase
LWYDLKGSTVNRFVKNKDVMEARKVLHDNNFQFHFSGRPLPIRYTINRILQICINNDTLCLSKSNIVDYSLLTIIDTKRKKVRFGIIDFVQQYTIDKVFEGQFKRIINRGEVPTIVDPEKYKYRFKRAMKRYFIGMVTQEEKLSDLKGGKEHPEIDLVIEEKSDEEDELNQT